MDQPTLLGRKEAYCYNFNTRKPKPSKKHPNTVITSSSKFYVSLQNWCESFNLLDSSDPNNGTTAMFDTSKAQTKQMNTPVHKVSTSSKKVPSENVLYEQSCDTVVHVSKSYNPNKEQDKCQKPDKMGSKIIWPQVTSVYLFGVLRRFQHCTGHITTGS